MVINTQDIYTRSRQSREWISHFINWSLQPYNQTTNPFENIDVKYQIFYTVDGVKGEKNQELIASGKTVISSITPRTGQDLTTDKVKLTKIRPLPASECAGGT